MHDEMTFKEFVIRRHPADRGHHYVTVTEVATGRDLVLDRQGKSVLREAVQEHGLSPNGVLLYATTGEELTTHQYGDALLDHVHGLRPKVNWIAWDGVAPIATRSRPQKQAQTGYEPPRQSRRGIVGGRRR